MTNKLSSKHSDQILSTFASILGLFTIYLYFTAWIYRWTYLSYFSLEINRLSFSFHSFFFVPLQVFVGNGWAFAKTVLALILVAMAIKVTLWLLQPLSVYFILPLHSVQLVNQRHRRQFSWQKLAKGIHQFPLVKILRNLASVVPQALQKDLVIVIWLLIVLFWLARFQGWQDARRDAVNETSTLPVFTYVFHNDQSVVGRKLDDLFLNPALAEHRIIGDYDLFKSLQGTETNDKALAEPRVWRLLLENNDWIYCIRALSSDAVKNEVPLVLAIPQDKEGQFMILAPQPPSKP